MATQTPSSPSPSLQHHREGESSEGVFRSGRRGAGNVQTQERKKNWKIMLRAKVMVCKILTDTSRGTSRSVRPLWPQPIALALLVWMAVWLPSTWMAACDVTTSVPMNTRVSHEHLTTNIKCILSSGGKLLLDNFSGDWLLLFILKGKELWLRPKQFPVMSKFFSCIIVVWSHQCGLITVT